MSVNNRDFNIDKKLIVIMISAIIDLELHEHEQLQLILWRVNNLLLQSSEILHNVKGEAS